MNVLKLWALLLLLWVNPVLAQTDRPPDTLQNIQRIRPVGPATIDCVTLHDSRCGNRLVAAPPITCTVQVSSATLTLMAGSASTAVSAVCTGGATQFQWTASSGTLPSGASTPMTYSSAGNYCYTVRGGGNSGSYGPLSAPVCVTVSGAACSGADYSATAACPNPGDSGYVLQRFTFNSATCQYSLAGSTSYCMAAVTACPTDQVSSSACPGGQIGSVTTTTTYSGASCTPATTSTSTCACPSGQSLQGGVCVSNPCPADQVSSSACPGGLSGTITTTTMYSGSSCIPSTTSSNSCACPPGTSFDFDRNFCRPNTEQCLSPRSLVNGVCQCPIGQTFDGVACIAAPPPPPACDAPRVLIGGVCQCAGGLAYDAVTNSCLASVYTTQPATAYNGGCSAIEQGPGCSSDSIFDASTGVLKAVFYNAFPAKTFCASYQYSLQRHVEGEFWVTPVYTGTYSPCPTGSSQRSPFMVLGESFISGYCPKSGGCTAYAGLP